MTWEALGLSPLVGLSLICVPNPLNIRSHTRKELLRFRYSLCLRRSDSRSSLGVFLANSIIALRSPLYIDIAFGFAHAETLAKNTAKAKLSVLKTRCGQPLLRNL